MLKISCPRTSSLSPKTPLKCVKCYISGSHQEWGEAVFLQWAKPEAPIIILQIHTKAAFGNQLNMEVTYGHPTLSKTFSCVLSELKAFCWLWNQQGETPSHQLDAAKTPEHWTPRIKPCKSSQSHFNTQDIAVSPSVSQAWGLLETDCVDPFE